MSSPVTRIKLAFTILVMVQTWACSSAKRANIERAQVQPAIERTCEIENADASTDDISAGDAGAPANADVKYLENIGCLSDFDTLASLPLEVTIPGVRTTKYVIDMRDSDHLYFQNVKLYPIHYEFVKANVENPGSMDNFNVNYYGPESDRRFLLGEISHYEALDIWALELAPYDTASPIMIKRMFDAITADKAYFRPALAFHPTSTNLEKVASQLDPSIPVVTSDEIFAKTDFQPLVRGTSEGLVTFMTASDVQSGTYIPYYSIVVLDEPPNSISVTQGIITSVFQTSLSHLNVLATNRGTPNMGLKNAYTNPELLQFKDKWVKFTVTDNEWSMQAVTADEGMAYYKAHRPQQVTLPTPDLSVTDIIDVEDVVPDYVALNNDLTKTQSDVLVPINAALRAYGGKSTNYSICVQAGVSSLKAFAIPIYYYDKFMRDNGFYDMIDGFMQDDAFNNDANTRELRLQDLRNAMMTGAIDQELQATLRAKLANEFTGKDGKPIIMRFRTSTNSEDLAGFPCAGCYNSQQGDPSDWEDVLNAIRAAYSTAWLFRTFEERTYYQVDQKSLGMGLLVHAHYPNDNTSANGVAVTTNPYDVKQINAEAYYVNVEYGGQAKVVALPNGVTTDEFLYYVGAPNTPTDYLSHSNILPAGMTTVLTGVQIRDLADSLTTIKDLFRKAYTDHTTGWHAMVVELDYASIDAYGNPAADSRLWIREARPYPKPN